MKNKIKDFINTYKKEVTVFSVLTLFITIYLLSTSFGAVNPVKSVIITSENTSYENNEPASWQVTKSGEWTAKGEATVTFDVDTVLKTNNEATDIIFVLDISGSMSGDKLARVKSDSTELINNLLEDSNNRAALITFDTTSTIVSGLTNNAETLTNQINDLQYRGNTNYYQALVNVDTILQNYTKEDNREMIVLFLTDGYPNVDTPNQIAEYQYLKEQYPYITINGIQYEMGDTVLNPIKEISDNQYLADMETLNNVLFDASVSPVTYETYQIVDYVKNDYFTLESEDDITVSQGSVELTEEDGLQKITWTIDNLKSGSSASLSMKLKLKDEYIGVGGLYETNEKEEIISKIDDTPDEDVESTLTPILADNYKVIYDGNAPDDCTVENIPTEETHSVFDTVAIKEDIPTCSGYEFKGWEIVTEDVTKVNDDYFIMPGSDVIIRATWSSASLAKSMDGTVSNVQTLYKVMQDQAVMDNTSSEFVSSSNGIDFSRVSSNTNGKGVYERAGTENDEYPIYYFRGDVDNNHVKFAGFCWKAVRTTETGGVKLIYDGVPDENGYCDNTGTASQIGTSAFNSDYSSPADVGYMYGTRYTYNYRSVNWYNIVGKSTSSIRMFTVTQLSSTNNFYYGDSITYDETSNTYTLNNATQYRWSDNYSNLRGYYTCFSSTSTSCTTPYYIGGSTPYHAYYRSVGQEKIGLGQTVTYQDGMYTITDYEEIDATDYYSNYSNYEGYYICETGTTNTCSEINYMNSTGSSIVTRVTMSNGETYDNLVEQANNTMWIYGNDVTWDGSNYTLVDTTSSSPMNWSSDRTNLSTKYHYTCLSTNNTCSSVYYIHYFGDSSSVYYLTLSNGNDIESAKNEMFTNTTDSRIKVAIDTWYEENILDYGDYLEDTVWCNDRSFYSGSLKGKDENAGTSYSYFGAYGRVYDTDSPTTTCANANDSFTVNSENGNGALTYPVALLTADEIMLAGGRGGYSNYDYYLYTGQYWWSLSPDYFNGNGAHGFYVSSSGNLYYDNVGNTNGVRPSVSFAPNIMVVNGDGSSTSPYEVMMEDDIYG